MKKNHSTKAVFLDRDGVINKDYPAYPHKIEHLKLIKNSAKGISILNSLGFLVIIITNQAGIAKKIFKKEDTIKFNQELVTRLSAKGAKIDQIYFCPHHPQGIVKKYRRACRCRKPGVALLRQATKDFKINLSKSYLIGDKMSDIKTGEKAGCNTILVSTGHGQETLKEGLYSGKIAPNLYEAAKAIRQNENI